ncbi:MAG: hypothetical protein ICV72_08890 [Aldersonia sp.]|nr:hypothetical protein [Aldersonia sp.]
MTIFDPVVAAAAATRVLSDYSIRFRATTFRFGFPVIERPNVLLRFSVGLRMSGMPSRTGWTLADDRASTVIVLAGPANSVTVTWWDEHAALAFAYPVAVVEHRPSAV